MVSETRPNERRVFRNFRLHRLFAFSLFLLLVFVSVAQAYYVFREVQRMAQEASVMSAASIADHFIRELSLNGDRKPQKELSQTEEIQLLHNASKEFSDIAADMDFYLVSQSGEIQAAVSKQHVLRQKIDLQPLAKFLELPRDKAPLVFGEDPADLSARVPFFTSKISSLRDSPYLYVVLQRTYLLRSLRFRFDEYLPRLAAFTLLAQILVALGVAVILRRLLTERIRELSQALGAYRSGDYSTRIEAKGRDEISELTLVANSMAETIQNSIEQLEERDELRRELIANVSHDLRSPASVLQGYSSLLIDAEKELSEAERKTVYSAISSSSLALSRLLDQLWDLSRLEAKERTPEKEDFCVGELVSELVEQFQGKAQAKSIELSERIPAALAIITADPALITRALNNLIENAIYYTPAEGRISVEVVPHSTSVQILVRDSGAGVAESDLAKITLRAYRGKTRESTNDKAAGLGLAIVSRILDLHGTSLQVASVENQGSTFGFELPRKN